MGMFGVGAAVFDRRCREVATVCHVLDVPPGRDLFGRRVGPERRYILVFPDGRWANDRTSDDIAAI